MLLSGTPLAVHSILTLFRQHSPWHHPKVHKSWFPFCVFFPPLRRHCLEPSEIWTGTCPVSLQQHRTAHNFSWHPTQMCSQIITLAVCNGDNQLCLATHGDLGQRQVCTASVSTSPISHRHEKHLCCQLTKEHPGMETQKFSVTAIWKQVPAYIADAVSKYEDLKFVCFF